MTKISKLESRKTVMHIMVQCSNEKPGSSISANQGKTSKVFKTMTNYKQNVFFLGHFGMEVPHTLIREHVTQHMKT